MGDHQRTQEGRQERMH